MRAAAKRKRGCHKGERERRKQHKPPVEVPDVLCASTVAAALCGGGGSSSRMQLRFAVLRASHVQRFPCLEVPGLHMGVDAADTRRAIHRNVSVVHVAHPRTLIRVTEPVHGHGDDAILLHLLATAMEQYKCVRPQIDKMYAADGGAENARWPLIQEYESLSNSNVHARLKYNIMCILTAITPHQRAIINTLVCGLRVSPLRVGVQGRRTGEPQWEVDTTTPRGSPVLTADGRTCELLELIPGHTPVALVRAMHSSSRLNTCLVRRVNAKHLITKQQPSPSRPHSMRALEVYRALLYIPSGQPPGMACASMEAEVGDEWRMVYPYDVLSSGVCAWRISDGTYVEVDNTRPLQQMTLGAEGVDFQRWIRYPYPGDHLLAAAALGREFVLLSYNTGGTSCLLLRGATSSRWLHVGFEIRDHLSVLRVVASDGMRSYVACIGRTTVYLVRVEHAIEHSIRLVANHRLRRGVGDATVFRRRLCLPASAGEGVQILDYSCTLVLDDRRRHVSQYARRHGMCGVSLWRVIQAAHQAGAYVPYHEVHHRRDTDVREYSTKWAATSGEFNLVTAHEASRTMFAAEGNVIYTSRIHVGGTTSRLRLNPMRAIRLLANVKVTCLLSGVDHILCAADDRSWLFFHPDSTAVTISAERLPCAEGIAGPGSSFHPDTGLITIADDASALYQPGMHCPDHVDHTPNPLPDSGTPERLSLEEVKRIAEDEDIEDPYRHTESNGFVRLSDAKEVKCHAVAAAMREMRRKGDVYLVQMQNPALLEIAIRSWSEEWPLRLPTLRRLCDAEPMTCEHLLSPSSYAPLRGSAHSLSLRETDMLLVLLRNGGVVQLAPRETSKWFSCGDDTGSMIVIRCATAGVTLLPDDLESRTTLQRSHLPTALWACANVKLMFTVHAGQLHAYFDASASTGWHRHTPHVTHLVVQASRDAVAPQEVWLDYNPGAGSSSASSDTSFDPDVGEWAGQTAAAYFGRSEVEWHGRQPCAPFAAGQWCDLETADTDAIRRMRAALRIDDGPGVVTGAVTRRFLLPHYTETASVPGISRAQRRQLRMLCALEGKSVKALLRDTAAADHRNTSKMPTAAAPAASRAAWEIAVQRRILQWVPPPAVEDEREIIAMLAAAIAADDAMAAREQHHHQQRLELAVEQDRIASSV